MSVSLKGLCLVILGGVKEHSRLTCGKSFSRVQTLMSRFVISTVLIVTVNLFCFLYGLTKNHDLCRLGYLYVAFQTKSPYKNDFRLITHIIGVYMVNM